jgi:hypothetical protein
MTTNNELAEQIERLVRTHIESTRSAAASAVERAFAAFAATPQPGRDQPRGRGRAGTSGASRSRRCMAPRRATEAVAALAEQFYVVLCRNPGAAMTTLAPQVGVAPRVLHLAVARLKRAGRVRSVGQRAHTRYFPMTNMAAVAA